MRSPSMIGVGLAGEFLSCIAAAVVSVAEKTSVFQTSAPVPASKHSARSEGPLPLCEMPDVTKMRLRSTTGDDQPAPGTACFHMTFFLFDHSRGRFFSVECPWPVGPRNSGHSAADAIAATKYTRQQVRRRFTMGYSELRRNRCRESDTRSAHSS